VRGAGPRLFRGLHPAGLGPRGPTGPVRGSRILRAWLLCPLRLVVSGGLRARGVLYPATYYPATSYPATYYPGRYYGSYPTAYVAAAPVLRAVWTGPRVVQYAHGRYELRGDGVSVPYAWVWIPNAVPAAAAPAGLNQDGPEGSGSKTPRPSAGPASRPGFV
jgi:hypothetical protein